MQKQNGFTLIELIIVIVILGVLAVTAAPRFINISSDAKIAVIDAVAASIRTAAEQSRLKATIAGAENNARSGPSNLPEVFINDQSFELKYGYPEAFAEDANAGDLLDLLNLSDDLEICYSITCINGGSSRVKIGFDTTEDTGCYVRYSEPGGTGAPSATEYGLLIVTEGC